MLLRPNLSAMASFILIAYEQLLQFLDVTEFSSWFWLQIAFWVREYVFGFELVLIGSFTIFVRPFFYDAYTQIQFMSWFTLDVKSLAYETTTAFLTLCQPKKFHANCTIGVQWTPDFKKVSGYKNLSQINKLTLKPVINE